MMLVGAFLVGLVVLYALALQDPQEEIHFFADRVTLGSISMRSLLIQ